MNMRTYILSTKISFLCSGVEEERELQKWTRYIVMQCGVLSCIFYVQINQ